MSSRCKHDEYVEAAGVKVCSKCGRLIRPRREVVR